MRYLKTFVLHLYIDSTAPERVCGDVRLINEGEKHSFKHQNELEALLLRLIRKIVEPKTLLSGADAYENE